MLYKPVENPRSLFDNQIHINMSSDDSLTVNQQFAQLAPQFVHRWALPKFHLYINIIVSEEEKRHGYIQ